MSSCPSEICPECRAVLGDVWIAQFWLYCRHSRVMARRRAPEDAWTLDRGTSPAKAERHITAALAKMQAYCDQRGISLEDAFSALERLRSLR
jgi:hypothetical protein